jgi:hypothetical protein
MTRRNQIEVSYIRTNGNWTYEIINHNSGLKTLGDLYPGSKKGLDMAKRDSQDIVKHLRKNNKILVKR